MSVILLLDPPKDVRPEGALRGDVAWKLFMPETIGDIPRLGHSGVSQFRHWLWNGLSSREGFLKKEKGEVYLILPPLTEPAMEFVVSICSLWSGEVYSVEQADGKYDLTRTGKNLWKAPVVNLNRHPEEGTFLGKMTETLADGFHTFYSGLLGETKSFIRTYTLKPGQTYARFHSHTAREELYLVLKGSGSVRIGDSKVRVTEGDLISKPLGPDISSQFLADQNGELRILDIEIWPDVEKNSKDAVAYPDHGELDLFGPGWELTVPLDSMIGAGDAIANYDTGYWRKADGTWEPRDIPGFKRRSREKQ